MVGWQTMDTGESWLDGLDWTSVEVGQHASRKGRAVVLVNLDAAGLLLVTNFRLLFLGEGAKQLVPLGTIPLATIEKVTKLHLGRSPPASRLPGAAPLRPVRRLLHIVGKDMRSIVFGFRPRTKQRRTVHEALTRLMRPSRLYELYAFSTNVPNGRDPRMRLRAEYMRMISATTIGTDTSAGDSNIRSEWRLSDVNANYNVCPTYPSLLVMPASFSDEEVQQAAAFRARGRLPVLCWQHPGNGAVLARSSQPLIGIMMNSRSNADEKLVAALCAPPCTGFSQRRKLYIADARPRKNALANGAMGGGSESSANYLQCEVVFLGIDNIHAMRDSLARLRDFLDIHGAASSDGSSSLLRSGGWAWGGGNATTMSGALSALGDSGWLVHCHTVLIGAAWIAARIALEGASVLVHCSDGWDRTTQLISVASILLDPYYRTFQGFQALVEKDWLAYGHLFAERLGTPTYTGIHIVPSSESLVLQMGSVSTSPVRGAPGSAFTSAGSHTPAALSSNYSPIFLQWIDCVAQLLRIYPSAFEFSAAYLVELMDCVLSCRFGNFLCNSEKERVQAGIAESTGCVWAHLEQLRESGGKKHEHYNLYYNNVKYSGILLPPAAALFPTLWPHFFLRWSCPSPVSTGGCLPVGWTHGGELELEAHALAQSFSSLQNAKEKAESKLQELMTERQLLLEQLQEEQEGRLSATSAAGRARRETAALKQVIEAMGGKIHISSVSSQLLHTSDEETKDLEDANTEHRPDYHLNDNGSEQHQLAVSLCMGPDFDGPGDASRRPCGAELNSSCSLRANESCCWPQSSCIRMGSAFIGLRTDFDALEQLSILDRYFDVEQPDVVQPPCSPPHPPGVT
ncbi:hypothetical protein BDL97_03G033800 [Sphagnum fallax]|nr:hypothetical protein BDL97_03G033800 [Sphagnum fallax]